VSQLRVFERVTGPCERLSRYVGITVEDRSPLAPRAFAETIEEQRTKCPRIVGIGDVRRRAEPLLLGQVLEVERAQQGREQSRCVLAELHPHAVTRSSDEVEEHRHVSDAQGPVGSRRPAGQVVHRHRAQEARADALPNPGALALDERSECALQRQHGSAVRRDRHGGERGTLAREQNGELMGSTASRDDHALVAGHLAQRMAASEPRDLAVDQPRVRRGQALTVDTQPISRRRLERRDDDVSPGRELVQRVARRVGLEVERDALFAPAPHRERGQSPQSAAPRGIDHEHIGTVIGEHHAGERRRDALSDLDDAQAIGERRSTWWRRLGQLGHDRD
jgi:hypothetical protein